LCQVLLSLSTTFPSALLTALGHSFHISHVRELEISRTWGGGLASLLRSKGKEKKREEKERTYRARRKIESQQREGRTSDTERNGDLHTFSINQPINRNNKFHSIQCHQLPSSGMPISLPTNQPTNQPASQPALCPLTKHPQNKKAQKKRKKLLLLLLCISS